MQKGIWLHRIAVFTACCTFLLVIAGGLVTSTGSGLSVPDWPLSYGQLMPPMVGGVFYEHSHRMIATFVGMLTVTLAIWLWKTEERRWMRMVGVAAVGGVIMQGVLGGLTVLYFLPTWISVLHATIAQSFFSLTVFIALATSEGWKRMRTSDLPEASRTRSVAVATTAVILLQLMLGAWMRHSDAGLAITDFPLSNGALVPATSAEDLMEVNDSRIAYGLAPVTAGQIWIHFAHRVGALLVLFMVYRLVRHVLATYKDERRLREPVIILATLVLMQALLGALTVWTGKGVQIATAHVATGALVLALSAFVVARVFRLHPVQVHAPNYSAIPISTNP